LRVRANGSRASSAKRRTLAALNPPNIGAIHGVGGASGASALVLELVEGPTRADRIAQGAIPVDEAHWPAALGE
jgi:hypothetical protein